jgi:hypothetical protein
VAHELVDGHVATCGLALGWPHGTDELTDFLNNLLVLAASPVREPPK